MIDKLSLPTDNLYKFISLSGILLLIFSFFPFYVAHKITIDVIELQGKVNKCDVKTDFLELSVSIYDIYEERMGTFIENLSDPNLILGEENGMNMIRRVLDKKDSWLKNALEIKLNLVEAKTYTEMLGHKFKEYKQWFAVCVLSFIMGSICVWVGFSKWYSKTQKYQDEILKKQVEK